MKRADILWTLARKEISDRLRNRWIWTVSVLIFGTALAIAFFGSAPVGVVGVARPGAAMASLINLSTYLVPLLALLLGAGAIVDEKRRGTLDLILSYPVGSGEYFLGTFLGYAFALWIALLGSYLPAGWILAVYTGIDFAEYLSLLALVLLLGSAFLAISFVVSILSRDRGRSAASSVLVWVVAVFLFDLALVGALVLYQGEIGARLFGVLMLLNPSDVFRLLCFSWVGSAAAPLGLASVMPPFPDASVLTVFLLWTTVPLLLGLWLFRRRFAYESLIG